MVKNQCHFRAKSLFTPVNIYVLLPSYFEHANTVESLDHVYRKREKFKTLFLLHGAVEDADSWLSYTNIEKYADKHNVALVVASVGNSWYTNLKHGPAYWDFISDELPRFIRSVFPLSEKREDNYVAGLSMGGYGAMKLALCKPEMFSAVMCLSGGVDITGELGKNREMSRGPNNYMSKEYFPSLDELDDDYVDLFEKIKTHKKNGTELPRIYFACGTEDFTYDINKEFVKFLTEQSIDHTFEDGPGAHTWEFWDEYIQKALDWLTE